MLTILREKTDELHKAVEKDNLAKLILDHSISLEQYQMLLLQNYLAYRIVEDEIRSVIPDFSSDKSQRLYKDLKRLHIDASEGLQLFGNQFQCRNKMEGLGACYVLEGSAMGGMIIARELDRCKALKAVDQHHFYNMDRQNMAGWKSFTRQINALEFSEQEIDTAVSKARETFRFFQKIFSYRSTLL